VKHRLPWRSRISLLVGVGLLATPVFAGWHHTARPLWTILWLVGVIGAFCIALYDV
jgi:hypothetical protein